MSGLTSDFYFCSWNVFRSISLRHMPWRTPNAPRYFIISWQRSMHIHGSIGTTLKKWKSTMLLSLFHIYDALLIYGLWPWAHLLAVCFMEISSLGSMLFYFSCFCPQISLTTDSLLFFVHILRLRFAIFSFWESSRSLDVCKLVRFTRVVLNTFVRCLRITTVYHNFVFLRVS